MYVFQSANSLSKKDGRFRKVKVKSQNLPSPSQPPQTRLCCCCNFCRSLRRRARLLPLSELANFYKHFILINLKFDQFVRFIYRIKVLSLYNTAGSNEERLSNLTRRNVDVSYSLASLKLLNFPFKRILFKLLR